MAKIKSLLRRVSGGEPAVFQVGSAVEPDGQVVTAIRYKSVTENLTAGCYRGRCYVIEYGEIGRTIIPAEEIIDLYVEEQKKEEELPVPPLPE